MGKNIWYKRVWNLFSSMKAGMVMLLFMAVFSISGTLIPQGSPLTFYAQNYSGFVYNLIRIFHLDRVYTSWWFVLLVLLLSFNLLFCSIRRLPQILKTLKKKPTLEDAEKSKGAFYRETSEPMNLQSFFKSSGFRKVETQETGNGTFYFSRKHPEGNFGSWITHLGLFLIILFYTLGKAFGYEALVYGVPGTDQPILDTGYHIEIQDFDIQYRQDYSVNQYITDLQVYDEAGTYRKSGRLMVNQPFRGKGFNVYQNGTGWALDVVLQKDGEDFSERTLYQSEVYVDDEEKIALQFIGFYPDFVLRDGVPYTLSPFPKNPKFLYTLYHEGKRVFMNVASPGERITYEGYTFAAYQPRLFTVVQVVSDPGAIPVGIGGAFLLIGIFLSFYRVPQELYAFSGADGRVWVSGHTRKSTEIFKERLGESFDEGLTQKISTRTEG